MKRPITYVSALALGLSLSGAAVQSAAAGPIGETIEEARQNVSVALSWGDLTLEDYNAPEVTYDGPPIEMVMTHHAPEPSTLIKNSMEPGAKVLEKMSNGKIKVTRRFGGVVHGAAEGMEATRTGLSHYAPCFSNYHARDFKLISGLSLPGLFPSAHHAVATVEDLYAELLKDEFERLGSYVAKYSMTSAYHLLTKVEVRTPDQAQGMKIRSSGGLHGDALQALGMNPVSMPISDVYPGFQRGVLDGVSLTDSATVAFKIHELAEFRTAANINRIAVEYCVSPRFFDELPADLQRVFNAWARQHAQYEAQIFYELGDMEALAAYEKVGVTLIDPTPEEQAKWDGMLANLKDEWLAKADADGIPATETYAKISAHAAELKDMSANDLMRRAINDPVMTIYTFK